MTSQQEIQSKFHSGPNVPSPIKSGNLFLKNWATVNHLKLYEWVICVFISSNNLIESSELKLDDIFDICNIDLEVQILLPIPNSSNNWLIDSVDKDFSNTNLTTREQDSFTKMSSDISLNWR